uniref:Uncharacterized protein n=1 Tax=Thermogemmatispora argillosa TaxID=2045280 RepID=A0A455T517_9CHLR|nr:hypothetical protein KTA_18440 [Thermogemmatispora argillosa]
MQQKAWKGNDWGERWIPAFERYSYRAKKALVEACRIALQAGRYWLAGPDLLAGVLANPQEEERTYLAQLGIDLETLKQRLRQLVRYEVTGQEATSIEGGISPAARQALSAAALEAGALGHERIEPLHLLLGLIVCQLPPLSDYLAGPECIENARQIAQQHEPTLNGPETEPEVVLIDMARQQVIATRQHFSPRKWLPLLLAMFFLEIIVGYWFVGRVLSMPLILFLNDLNISLDYHLLILSFSLIFYLILFLSVWMMASLTILLPIVLLVFREAKALGLVTTTAGQWLRLQFGHWLGVTLALSLFIGLLFGLRSLSQTWWWLPIWLLLIVWRCYSIGWRSHPRVLLPGVRRPLPAGEIQQRCASLLQRLNLTLEGIYVYDAKGRLAVSNAYATGLGARRRIWLTDSLLKRFRPDEIEVICAHEIAHHVYHDLRKRLIWAIFSDMITILSFYLLIHLASDIALDGTIILLVLIVPLVWLGTRIFLSRFIYRQEVRADSFALQQTGKVQAYRNAMIRLTNHSASLAWNRRERRPGGSTYPSLVSRLALADLFQQQQQEQMPSSNLP